ncbi:hypothetical protein HHK36_031338 [Tetracentron sinense]|uniref:Homeobox-leucine zipper protein n=1 Tax=Tetracentron sinense TaxID=13715 RepID=A0A834YEJ1_TETSI|nr:hypothetical protein HHK36_031338 [Tetracentron sinense]
MSICQSPSLSPDGALIVVGVGYVVLEESSKCGYRSWARPDWRAVLKRPRSIEKRNVTYSLIDRSISFRGPIAMLLQHLAVAYPHSILLFCLHFPAGEVNCRRRRKKSKGEPSGVGTRKRKLSAQQINLLEMNFCKEHKLESERKDRLASELGLDPRQVAVWFQNRRARLKSQKLEEEFSKLKKEHESVVAEKCLLETQVIKLNGQLLEAEKAIQRLSESSVNGVSSSDLSSSSSMVADPHFLGEFGGEGFGNVFYVAENYYIPGMGWVNLYDL